MDIKETSMKISFLGFGKFAKIMASGLRSTGSYQLHGASPSLKATKETEGVTIAKNNIEVVREAQCVILAVKPPQARAVLTEVGQYLSPDSVLISVVTGVSTEALSACCRSDQAIIRAMPNSPVAVRQGMTALYKSLHVSTAQAKLTEVLFERLGRWSWVENEIDIDRLTALSGSGPAYVFLFLQALIEGGVALGLSETVAKTFAFEMVTGSVVLAKESALDLKQLRSLVTSPGGTTQAALTVFEQGHFEQLIKQALQAAYLRAQALAQ